MPDRVEHFRCVALLIEYVSDFDVYEFILKALLGLIQLLQFAAPESGA